MALSMDPMRRAFLRGRLAPPEKAVRPPWAIAERDFLAGCTRCGDCLRSCPESILAGDADGFPVVDFFAGGCTFCRACVDACGEPLFLDPDRYEPWSHVARVAGDCLAWRGVFCMTCRDACNAGAMVFDASVTRLPVPMPDLDACIGCGACVAACPAAAIAMADSDRTGARR